MLEVFDEYNPMKSIWNQQNFFYHALMIKYIS